MIEHILHKIISFGVAIVLVTQPAINSYSQTAPGNLAPDSVSAGKHMTAETELSSQSIVSDAQFLSFAAFVYKTVVEEGEDAESLFSGLKTIPFWGEFVLRDHLSKNFVDVNGDKLSIKFRDGGVFRVVPAENYVVLSDGDIGDGMKPDKYYGTDEHVFQYFGPKPGASSAPAMMTEDEVGEIYEAIFEKALPYYQKARPGDIEHVSWMMLQAARIARQAGLDERVLLPIVILHDVGYAACTADEHARSFDEDVKIKHMKEGAVIARNILEAVGYDPELIERIARYVSVHDNWRMGDNAPFKECREMGVFQDLDFTWMATPEGFESARTRVFGKNPREMLEFLKNDDKHTERPFAAAETAELYRSQMADRERAVAASELGAADEGKAMLPFGPMLSYEALRIAPETKGIYITVDLSPQDTTGKTQILVCRAEAWAGVAARETAEMLNQVLQIMEMRIGDPRHYENDRIVKHLHGRLDSIKRHMMGQRVDVATSPDLMANSAMYGNTLVMNDALVTAARDMWNDHREDPTAGSWVREVGIIWMVAERLYHELGHKEDEVYQALEDRLFYIGMASKEEYLKNAIKVNSLEMRDVNGRKAAFGEAFRSDMYFRMIHRIAAMQDKQEAIRAIREYMAEAMRHNSSKEALGLTDRQIASASGMLKAHGIKDDIFGEKLLGMDLGRFLEVHSLYSSHSPYFDRRIEGDRREWFFSVLKRNVRGEDGMIRTLINVGRMIGDEAGTQRWINNRLKTKSITGRDSMRRKLKPIIDWASHVVCPQNYEMRGGKLFGGIEYEGMNLMTLPIFPLDENGEINWELFRWAFESSRAIPSVRGPPMEYFNSKKVSLYEYIVTRDRSRAQPPLENPAVEENPETKGSADAPKRLVQMDLFETGGAAAKANETEEDTASDGKKANGHEQQAPLFDAEPYSAPQFDWKNNIIEAEEAAKSVNVSSTVDEVTYILIDRDVPAATQWNIVNDLNIRSRGGNVAEKIIFMDTAEMDDFFTRNKCSMANTVMILGGESKIGSIASRANILIAKKQGAADFVNLLGLVGAARSLLNKDWDSFRRIYAVITGEECPEIDAAWLSDPVLLAKKLAMNLPRAVIIDVDEQKNANEFLREALIRA